MLRVALIALISLPGIDAAPPKRTCSTLSYDAYAVDGSPTVLSLAFLGQTPFFVLDSGKSDPFLQFLPVTRTTRGCGAIDGGPVTQPRVSFLGSQPMIAADFNGDGIPDAATVDFAANKVSIFLGDSTGALKPEASYTIGANPQSVAAADFNRDGKMDLVVADSGSGVSDPGSVAVLLGNGDGTFRSPAKFQAGAGPLALAVADINRDGNLDLVTVNERSGSVSTLLGRGDGSFQIQREVFIGQSPTSVVTADFNGDGLPDLAVTDVVSNSVTIMLGNGDGSYVPGTSYNTGDEPGYVAGADFNGDGKPDLAILFETTN